MTAIAEEEIQDEIKEMDYLIVTPKKLEASYYKLDDGTIIRALVLINAISVVDNDKKSLNINSTNVITAFVPSSRKEPHKFESIIPNTPPPIQEEDVPYTPLRENFSVYSLSDGSTLSVRTVVGQISKTALYTRSGEPVYNIQVTPIVKSKQMNK